MAAAHAEPQTGVHWGGYPIGNYTTDQGLTLGVLGRRFDYGDGNFRPFESVLTFQASHATQGPSILHLDFEKTGVTFLNLPKLRWSSSFTAAKNDDQRYYGLGDRTVRSVDLERQSYYFYSQQVMSFETSIRREVEPLGIDVQVAITPTFNRSRPRSSSPNEPTLYLANFGPTPQSSYYTATHLRLIRERRDSEFIPSEGNYSGIGYTYAPALLGQLPSWSRLDLDYRRYDSWVKDRWLYLATQARFSGSSSDAPLTEKARLGSLGTLRGLPLNRYVSNDSVSLRSELRSVWCRSALFDLPLKLGTGAFVDTGKISGNFGGLGSPSFHTGYGFSLFGSYFTDDFVGSTNVAFSEGTTSLYLILGYAF